DRQEEQRVRRAQPTTPLSHEGGSGLAAGRQRKSRSLIETQDTAVSPTVEVEMAIGAEEQGSRIGEPTAVHGNEDIEEVSALAVEAIHRSVAGTRRMGGHVEIAVCPKRQARGLRQAAAA